MTVNGVNKTVYVVNKTINVVQKIYICYKLNR